MAVMASNLKIRRTFRGSPQENSKTSTPPNSDVELLECWLPNLKGRNTERSIVTKCFGSLVELNSVELFVGY